MSDNMDTLLDELASNIVASYAQKSAQLHNQESLDYLIAKAATDRSLNQDGTQSLLEAVNRKYQSTTGADTFKLASLGGVATILYGAKPAVQKVAYDYPEFNLSAYEGNQMKSASLDTTPVPNQFERSMDISKTLRQFSHQDVYDTRKKLASATVDCENLMAKAYSTVNELKMYGVGQKQLEDSLFNKGCQTNTIKMASALLARSPMVKSGALPIQENIDNLVQSLGISIDNFLDSYREYKTASEEFDKRKAISTQVFALGKVLI